MTDIQATTDADPIEILFAAHYHDLVRLVSGLLDHNESCKEVVGPDTTRRFFERYVTVVAEDRRLRATGFSTDGDTPSSSTSRTAHRRYGESGDGVGRRSRRRRPKTPN